MSDLHHINHPSGINIACPECKSENVSVTEFPLNWKCRGKKFSDQIKECWANGTYGFEKCPACGNVTTACKRYGGRCESEKCREDRMPKDRPRHFHCYCREIDCRLHFVHNWYPAKEKINVFNND